MSGPPVHWQQLGLLALAEDNSHGDSCGPIIMLDYLHLLHGAPLDYPTINALRDRVIAGGWMTAGSGMTMGSIVEAMQTLYNVRAVKYVPWNNDYGSVLGELHGDLITALEAHQLVGMETHAAWALPGNQPGVQNHFILAGGIDSSLGYLCCNGDDLGVLARGLTVPAQQPIWYSWQNLVDAQISSYAIWEAIPSMAIILDHDAAAVLVGAHDADNAAITVGAGMAQTISDKGWLGAEITVPETALGSGEKVAVVRGAAKAALTYTPGEGVVVYGGTIAAAVQDLYALWQTLKNAPPAPPPAPPVNVKAQLAAVENDLAALKTALGSQAQ